MHPGDLYFNRTTDHCILCLSCWDKRKRRWAATRSPPDGPEKLLEFLRETPRNSHQMHEAYGPRYVSLIRKLILQGHPIWKRRVGRNVVYSFGEPVDKTGIPRPKRPPVRVHDSQEPGGWSERCNNCDEVIVLVEGEKPGRRFCQDCIDRERAAVISRASHN